MILNFQDVVAAAEAFFRKGHLSVQVAERTDCRYIYPDGSRCVVGAALTDTVIDLIIEHNLESVSIDTLATRGIIERGAGFDDICQLQYRYDRVTLNDHVGFFNDFCKFHHINIELEGK